MHRNVALDGLRGVAALMVFVHHVQLPGLERATIGLDVGVMLFFALSGYLLYRPFVDGHVGLAGYAVRRVLRIWPAFAIASLAVSALWYPWFLAKPMGVVTMQWTPIVIVWTLLIEVWFYISLPVIAAVLGCTARPHLWICWGAIASLAVGAAEIILTRTTPLGFPAWAWAFAPGMLLALPDVRQRLASIPVLALAAPALAVSVSINLGYPDLLGALGSGLVLAWAIAHPASGGRIALSLGALSYSVYLWHLPIIEAVNRPATWSGSALALGLTLAIATVSYLAVERPAMRLGRRLGRLADGRFTNRRNRHPIALDVPAVPEVAERPGAIRR